MNCQHNKANQHHLKNLLSFSYGLILCVLFKMKDNLKKVYLKVQIYKTDLTMESY